MLTNTWTYNGIDMSDGLPVDPITKLITIDSNTGAINVSQTMPVGNY